MKVPVTVINPSYPRSSCLAWLTGNGPKNAKIKSYQYPDQDGYETTHHNHTIILGHYPELVAKVRQAQEDYEKAKDQWYRDKERAIWEFKEAWDKEHPMPSYVDAKAMIGDLPQLLPGERVASAENRAKQTRLGVKCE